VLSPLLYAIFINDLAEVLRSRGLGIDAWGRRVPLLLYADDIVLLASTPEELQQMLDVTSAYARSWQFRFNTKPGKSNVVVVPATSANLADAERAAFRMGDGPLHLSQEYKYLGVEMGKTRGCWNSFLSRVHKTALKKVHSVLYAVASGDRPLKLDTAVHLFEAYVRPSVMPAACGAPCCRKPGCKRSRASRRNSVVGCCGWDPPGSRTPTCERNWGCGQQS
jgi:hypothetical protein